MLADDQAAVPLDSGDEAVNQMVLRDSLAQVWRQQQRGLAGHGHEAGGPAGLDASPHISRLSIVDSDRRRTIDGSGAEGQIPPLFFKGRSPSFSSLAGAKPVRLPAGVSPVFGYITTAKARRR